MKVIRGIREKMSAALDMPPEAMGERVCVTTSGFCYTTVDGCTSIVDYSPSHVILECATGRVVIEGAGLRVAVFTMSRVRIFGKVISITNGEAAK